MSKDDFVTGERLLNPYIEVERYLSDNETNSIHVNVSTFEKGLSHLIPSFIDNEPTIQRKGERLFAVYGVVGRTVQSPTGAYLNVTERPISKTLMGYLHGRNLKEYLPTIYRELTKR